jgi:hypothetical protein
MLYADVILCFNGKVVRTTKDVHNMLGLEVGKEILVEVRRGSEKQPVKLIIVSEPALPHYNSMSIDDES